MSDSLWKFLNSHLFLGALTLLFGGFVARFLSARWQRWNHRYQVGIKTLRSLCSHYVSWVSAFTAAQGRATPALYKRLEDLTAIIVFAQNLLPTREIIEKAQTFLDRVQNCTVGQDIDKPAEFEIAKKAFRPFAVALRKQIGLADLRTED